MIQPQDNIKIHLNMIKQEFIENSRFEESYARHLSQPCPCDCSLVDDTQQQMAANSRSSQKKSKDE